MENIAEKALFFSSDAADPPTPEPDPREAKYQLAGRLMDNIRYGEALRILETLGDYRNTRALLSEVRELQAYQEKEEKKLSEERRRVIQAREEREAKERRIKRAVYIAAAVICAVLLILFK